MFSCFLFGLRPFPPFLLLFCSRVRSSSCLQYKIHPRAFAERGDRDHPDHPRLPTTYHTDYAIERIIPLRSYRPSSRQSRLSVARAHPALPFPFLSSRSPCARCFLCHSFALLHLHALAERRVAPPLLLRARSSNAECNHWFYLISKPFETHPQTNHLLHTVNNQYCLAVPHHAMEVAVLVAGRGRGSSFIFCRAFLNSH